MKINHEIIRCPDGTYSIWQNNTLVSEGWRTVEDARLHAIRDFAAEARKAGFARNFIGILSGAELKAALLAADEAGEDWPSPGWLRGASPAAMRGVRCGWATWRAPAPEGAIELRSSSEQRVACGDRWFLFPE